MRHLPPDGKVRNAFRSFNLAPKAGGQVPSVKALAETLGFAVERVDLPSGMAGRLTPDPFSFNGYRIEVNANDSVLRQRFTVVHEIVHYFVHPNHADPFAPDKLRDDKDHLYLSEEQREESEANRFAAAIFFDEGALAAARSLHGDDLTKLSRHFGVSEKVVEIALKQDIY